MTSISDVARHAGVSSATVSRVLSGSDYPVKAETRQRVLDAAGMLGFRPNRLARGLVTARTNIIAAIVHDITDPYFAEVARALEDAARARGYQLLVSSSDRDPERELEWLELLLSYRIDGVIFASSVMENRRYQTRLRELLLQFRSEGRAVVRLAPHLAAIPGVTIDHRAAASDIVLDLVAQGHERIGMLSGPSSLRAARHRLEGYRSAVEQAGLVGGPNDVVESTFSSRGGAQAVAELLTSMSDVTAIFAGSDAMAIGALWTLNRAGVDVPGELSVAGFNDVELSSYLTPSLTTVHVPIAEQADQVLEMLVEVLRGEQPTTRVLPTTIARRGSTGPPRASTRLSAATRRSLDELRNDAAVSA